MRAITIPRTLTEPGTLTGGKGRTSYPVSDEETQKKASWDIESPYLKRQ